MKKYYLHNGIENIVSFDLDRLKKISTLRRVLQVECAMKTLLVIAVELPKSKTTN